MTSKKSPESIPLAAEAVLAGLAYTGLLVMAMFMRTSLYVHESWLFNESAWPLWIVEQLREGKMLYRDAAFPYGPLSPYYLLAGASIFGMSSFTMAVFSALPAALSAAASLGILAHAGISRPMRWLMMTLIIIPALFLLAVSMLPYGNLEVAFVLLVFCLWSPPDERSRWQQLAIGLTLGLLNLTKFGSCAAIGLTILVADAVMTFKSSAKPLRPITFIASLLRVNYLILAGFLLLEIPRIVLSWLWLPPGIWRDFVLFPVSTLSSYKTYDGAWDLVEFIRNAAWGYRIGTIFPKLLLIILVFGSSVWLLLPLASSRRARRDLNAADIRIAMAVFWFLTGFLYYYHHLYHVMVYSTPLLAAGCIALVRSPAALRWSVGALLAVASGGFVLAKLAKPDHEREPVTMRNGETLWLKPQQKQIYQQIGSTVDTMLSTQQQGSGAVVVWRGMGAGWHYFNRWPAATRHTFLMSPDWIRPFEEKLARAAFLSSSVFLVKLPADGDSLAVTSDPATWRPDDWLRVPSAWRNDILSHLAPPVRAEDTINAWIAFPVKKDNVPTASNQ